MEGVLSHSTSAPDCHGDSNPLCIFPSISLSFFFFFLASSSSIKLSSPPYSRAYSFPEFSRFFFELFLSRLFKNLKVCVRTSPWVRPGDRQLYILYMCINTIVQGYTRTHKHLEDESLFFSLLLLSAQCIDKMLAQPGRNSGPLLFSLMACKQPVPKPFIRRRRRRKEKKDSSSSCLLRVCCACVTGCGCFGWCWCLGGGAL